MRIVSWNCGDGFQKKYHLLERFNADVFVIQECRDPKKYNDSAFRKFSENHLWIGENRGLGVFANSGIRLSALDWGDYGLYYFLPCLINNGFKLLSVWACNNYIEDVYPFMKFQEEKLSNILILGDFNSNSIWDIYRKNKHERRTHRALVSALYSRGVRSIYHEQTGEDFGQEKTPTFFMYRKQEKPYHIDYAFSDLSCRLSIEQNSEWLNYSDHVPLIVDLIEKPS